jgi:3,4-dihydroxy 2-butanone 4-phosphate synthase/GTP cyclohydrolase II
VLDDVERAIKDIAAGKAVIVVDDEDRENEGDLIFAAEHATQELLAFMVRYTSGYVCAPLTEEEADRLDLPPQFHTNQDRRGTAYAVTVDAREGIGTGISAPSGCSPTPPRSPPTCPVPAMWCRCGPRPAECCAAPGTPRPRSTSPRWPGCGRPRCCAS